MSPGLMKKLTKNLCFLFWMAKRLTGTHCCSRTSKEGGLLTKKTSIFIFKKRAQNRVKKNLLKSHLSRLLLGLISREEASTSSHGWKEGSQKLQANKPLDDEHEKRQSQKLYLELKEFLSKKPLLATDYGKTSKPHAQKIIRQIKG